MTDSTKTTAASLAHLFCGSDTSLHTMAWLESVKDGLSNMSFQHLAVSNGTVSAAKACDIYGHFHTKAWMKLTLSHHWNRTI
jgi:hypothetical protein